MEIRHLPEALLHGGDYNPDQWLDCPEVLEEDIRLMKKAHINEASLGIFAWGKLEPEEGVYDFDWLEEIVDRLYENGIYTILATPTGALPRWMSEKYGEVRQVLSDGTRKLPGERHNFCPSSPVMRRKMRQVDEALSRRFGNHPGVIAWHLSNEYGGGGGDNGDSACYCPLCQAAFRNWLKERYGTLDELNHAWWTSFWSGTITDWNQIHAPSKIGEQTRNGLNLDWRRFVSDQMLDFMKGEIAAVRSHSDRPVTTNFMETFRSLNYFRWARDLDIVSVDNYPYWHSEPDDIRIGAHASFVHVMTRSLKKQPYLLMESAPSVVNWRPKNFLKRPGMHELSSLQAIACGSDSVQYFQWRKGRGGFEKYHGAVLDHKNGEHTRVFGDVTRVGARLSAIAPEVLGTCNRPRAALVFDWENWWAADGAAAVTLPLNYLEHCETCYRAFFALGMDVDLIDMEDPLTGYDLVVAPVNYMYRGNYMEHVRDFVAGGGTYVTTYWSGEVGETDLCFTDHHPLADVLGICTEESDVMPDHVKNRVLWDGKAYGIRGLCALVRAGEAQVLGTYEKDFYQGYPALTVNSWGKGKAWYVAAQMGEDFWKDFLGRLARETGTGCTLEFAGQLPKGVTVNERKGIAEGKTSVWFLQNFTTGEQILELTESYRDVETGRTVCGAVRLQPYQCLILKKD